MASGRLRLHGGRHHDLAGFGHVAQQFAQEVHPAPLPAAALEHALDRCRQAQVSVGDHQPGASEAALYCFAEEDARIDVNPLADRFADAERVQWPALNPPSSPPAMGERAGCLAGAWASIIRACQAPLVRTGGLPSRIR